MFDVRNFGVVGDGITDDTAAIQAAIDAAAAQHRGAYQRDERSQALCIVKTDVYCRSSYHCPRHEPESYAEYEAEHRSDKETS